MPTVITSPSDSVSENTPVLSAILEKRSALPSERAFLVGISGIDAAGKGFVTARLAEELEGRGLRVAVINVDGWLNLPAVRFDPADLAAHFYNHAIRFDELFAQLIRPLVRTRSIELEADFTEETATDYRKHNYRFSDVDLVLLEGIFLLKMKHRQHFDLTAWVDCSFGTALERAIERCQEGLPPAETIRAFQTIYFPAQRIHYERDNPRAAADFVIDNDLVTKVRGAHE